MKLYIVTAPSRLEVFADYASADDYRNKLVVRGYAQVTLVSRELTLVGSSERGLDDLQREGTVSA